MHSITSHVSIAKAHMNRLFLVALALVAATNVYANSGGRVNSTLTNSGGCGGGGCHGGSASASTSIRLAQTSPIRALPGQTINLTLVVENSSAEAAGYNLAIRTSATGTTPAGTLTAGEGSFVLLRQLTHTSPKVMQGGVAEFPFTWTAPTTTGSVFVQAIANAVDFNGSASSTDVWNFMPATEIIVAEAGSVELPVVNLDASVFPNPSSNIVAVRMPQPLTGSVVISVLDSQGNTVFRDRGEWNEATEYVWSGMDSQQQFVASGAYTLMIETDRMLYKARVAYVR
jgi:hypothetical protein